MSLYLDTLNVGDKVTMEGPIGKMKYLGNGNYLKMGKPLSATKVGLIAGGSGITPLYTLANCIRLANEKTCTIKLLYTNKTEGDILIKEELDDLDQAADNVSVRHTITREKSADERIFHGRVTMDMLKACEFPEPGPDTMIFMCGPKSMHESLKKMLVEEGGYDTKMVLP